MFSSLTPPYGVLRSTGEEVPDLAHHVLVARVLLHALRLAQHVHEDHRAIPLSYQARHLRIPPSAVTSLMTRAPASRTVSAVEAR